MQRKRGRNAPQTEKATQPIAELYTDPLLDTAPGKANAETNVLPNDLVTIEPETHLYSHGHWLA